MASLNNLHTIDEELYNYEEKADNAFRKGNFDEALHEIDIALKMDNEYTRGWLLKGKILFFMRNDDEALSAYTQIIELRGSNNFFLWCKIGDVLTAEYEYDLAIIAFEKAISLDATQVIAYYKKGDLLNLKKEYNEAIICFDLAQKNNPSTSILSKILYEQAISWNGLKQFYKALKSINAAIELCEMNCLDKTNSEFNLRVTKGDILMGLKLYDKALQSYNYAISIYPHKDVIMGDLLAKKRDCLYAMGKSLEADQLDGQIPLCYDAYGGYQYDYDPFIPYQEIIDAD